MSPCWVTLQCLPLCAMLCLCGCSTFNLIPKHVCVLPDTCSDSRGCITLTQSSLFMHISRLLPANNWQSGRSAPDVNLLWVFPQLAKRYGNVYGFFIGRRPAVVLNGLQALKEALVNRADDFSGRPRNTLAHDAVIGKGTLIAINWLYEQWFLKVQFSKVWNVVWWTTDMYRVCPVWPPAKKSRSHSISLW